MGTDRTPTNWPLAGIIVPDSRATLHAGTSTNLDEASPYPGTVDYDRATALTITPSGTPEDEDTLEIITVSPGFPETKGARFGWRINGDTNYRGRDLHNVITHSECPDWQTGANVGKRNPDVVGLSDGSLAFCADFPQVATDIRRVQVNVRSAAGAWAGWSTIHEEDSTGAAAEFFLHPRIIRLPNGNLEIYHLTYDHTNTDSANVRRWVSLDDGTTWATDGIAVLDTSVSNVAANKPTALCVEYSNGQYCMLIALDAATDRIEQWASRDLGVTFTEIDNIAGDIAAVSDPEMCVAGGYFVAIIQCDGDTEGHRTADAFTLMEQMDNGAISGGVAGNSHALAVDDTGIVYAFDESFYAASYDYGASWDPASVCTWWEDANESLDNIKATFHRGVVWMVHNAGTAIAANAGPHSFHCTQMGGPSQVTLPGKQLGSPLRRLEWHETYIPIQTLDTVTSMAYGAAGAPVILVQDGYQRTTNGVGDVASWADTDATNDLSVHARIAWSTTAGSTTE